MAAPAVPTFSAVIADRNIRVFGAAVTFLAKLGKEVTFEGSAEGVSRLRACWELWVSRGGRDCGAVGLMQACCVSLRAGCGGAVADSPLSLRPGLVTFAHSPPPQITLRAINDAKTSFGSVAFRPGEDAGAGAVLVRAALPPVVTRRSPAARPSSLARHRPTAHAPADFFEELACPNPDPASEYPGEPARALLAARVRGSGGGARAALRHRHPTRGVGGLISPASACLHHPSLDPPRACSRWGRCSGRSRAWSGCGSSLWSRAACTCWWRRWRPSTVRGERGEGERGGVQGAAGAKAARYGALFAQLAAHARS
jgi:hypothetical protein